jgi:hypothetical protein
MSGIWNRIVGWARATPNEEEDEALRSVKPRIANCDDLDEACAICSPPR